MKDLLNSSSKLAFIAISGLKSNSPSWFPNVIVLISKETLWIFAWKVQASHLIIRRSILGSPNFKWSEAKDYKKYSSFRMMKEANRSITCWGLHLVPCIFRENNCLSIDSSQYFIIRILGQFKNICTLKDTNERYPYLARCLDMWI